MSEPHKTPPPRRTIAVTIAGVLLLLPAAAFAYMAAVFATSNELRRVFAGALAPSIAPYSFLLPVGVGVVLALTFGWAGLATVLRWHGWRIWAGVVAWGMIVIFVLELLSATFAEIPSFIVLALAVFVLVAKRRECRPNFTAVFR